MKFKLSGVKADLPIDIGSVAALIVNTQKESGEIPWCKGLLKLQHAIRHSPHSFNMTKSRYSMDWFYPILSGALIGETAQQRIDTYWKKFVIPGQGVRCVSDRPG